LQNRIGISGGMVGNGVTAPRGIAISASFATLSNLRNNDPVTVGDGTLTLDGTITNLGEITVGVDLNATTLSVGSSAVNINGTFTRLGRLNLGSSAVIVTGAGGTLTNGANHLIAGAGTVGNNAIALVNNGTIIASGTAQTLTIDPSNGNFTNTDATHPSANALLTSVRVGTLSANNGTATLVAGGGSIGTSKVTKLSIAQAGRLDLSDHDFIVDYTGNSPISTIATFVANGF